MKIVMMTHLMSASTLACLSVLEMFLTWTVAPPSPSPVTLSRTTPFTPQWAAHRNSISDRLLSSHSPARLQSRYYYGHLTASQQHTSIIH